MRPTSLESFTAARNFLQARSPREALRAADAAESAGFDPDDCSALRWDCWMLLGDFEKAWRESDRIATRGGHDPHRFWDGAPLTGKRVMLRCLHGLGDAIQFIRYAPMLRQDARSLVVQCHPALVRLLQRADGVDQVITWGEGAPSEEPPWDSQIEINELPRLFRTTQESIPSRVPYIGLNAPPRCAPEAPKRIGLVWASSDWNAARSVPVRLLSDALRGGNAELRGLQHGSERGQVTPASPWEGDVLDTAGDMLTMDLIVSVDTMAAHLAGALGLPVWVLLPFEADWRWMLGRADSPWYPTMRLFRQPAPGDWPGALEQLRAALSTEDAKVVESPIRD